MFRFILSLCLILAGCGSAYVSPAVQNGREAGLNVEVIALTATSVAQANRTAYSPRTLPPEFYQVADPSGMVRTGVSLPEPSRDPGSPPATLELRLPEPVTHTPYTIGVGDVLLLATRQAGSSAEELAGLLAGQTRRQGYAVQDDGAIALPDVGRIAVAGLTLAGADAEIFRRLVEAGLQPSFSVEIAEFNSKKAAIGGAVKSPGLVPIGLVPLSLGIALAGVGGVTDAGDAFAVIRIYRGSRIYQIPVQDFKDRADLQQLPVLDGDSIFVDTEFDLARAEAYFAEQIRLADFRLGARVQALRELELEVGLRRAVLQDRRSNFQAQAALDGIERDHVYLAGEVAQQSRYALPFGRKAVLADALFDTGGLPTRTANPAQIYVLRVSGPLGAQTVQALHLDARNAINLVLATKLELRPSDIIFVAEQPVTRWNRVVAQIVPSLITSGIAAASN